MTSHPTEDDRVPQPNNADSLQAEPRSLLAALMDGLVKQFEHRGVVIHRHRGSITVTDPEDRISTPLGGRLLIESTSVDFAFEWIDAKADLYGGGQ